MKNQIKILFAIVFDLCGLNYIFRLINKNKVLILWYHGICDDDFTLTKERHITKSSFARQIKFLKKKRYTFLTMSQYIDFNKSGKIPSRIVVLTFDDGFLNVICNAYPIMKYNNAKGCIYLVSELLNNKEILWTDYIETVIKNISDDKFIFKYKDELITYTLDKKSSYEYAIKDIKQKLRSITDRERNTHLKQFRKLRSSEIPKEFQLVNCEHISKLNKDILEIGSHSCTHPNCTQLTTESELEKELKNSKIFLEKEFGQKVDHFCYPAGDYNKNIISHLKNCGYVSAVTILSGLNDLKTDLFQLKRICALENFYLFKASVSGSMLFFRNFLTRKIR